MASCPLVLFGCYTLQITNEEYIVNSDKDLDVVELWSGVESIVYVAHVAAYNGHQPLRAEGFDKHRSPGITDQEGPGCADITFVE